MKISKKLSHLLFIAFVVLSNVSKAQSNYPADYFASPVGIKIALSGTFGELRTNHLHSGIDIKTQGTQGLPLNAVADGFVSRISITPGGFGKAIYIDHRNGFTSVYGHCQKFTPAIEAFIKAEQYKAESFEIQLTPDAAQFPVIKGEIVGYSGNSGSSEGPHLHFEIRKTETETPLNPLFFGMPVKDINRPTIARLLVYPHGNEGRVQNKAKLAEFELVALGENYRLKNNDTINVAGEVYFGIETYDLVSNSENKNGVFSIELYVDSELWFSQKMEAFDFTESRYVNSLIDYRYFQKTGRRVQKSFIEPNNHLSVYAEKRNDGIILFDDNDFHTIKYVVSDVYGNQSILAFTVKSSETFIRSEPINSEKEIIFGYREDNWLERDNLVLKIPEEALYDTLHFKYSTEKAPKGCFSPLFHLHEKYTPLHTSCELKIKPEGLKPSYFEKALIVRLGEKSGQITALSSAWDDDFLTANIREFGKYTVMIDSIPPTITPVNIAPGKNIKAQKTIQVKMKDNLSGIQSYRPTIDGEWILMEWDPKNDLLTYFINEKMKPGKNQFVLEVTDGRQNKKVYKVDLVK